MKNWVKVVDEEKKLCIVGGGTDTEFYKKDGFIFAEIETAWNGAFYLKGYAPEKPIEVKQAEVRADRDNKLNGIFWRIERYQTQREAALETTDAKDIYSDLLLYLQYLRDYPDNKKEEWWEKNALDFDEWRKK